MECGVLWGWDWESPSMVGLADAVAYRIVEEVTVQETPET